MAIVQPPADGTRYSSREVDLGEAGGAAHVQGIELVGAGGISPEIVARIPLGVAGGLTTNPATFRTGGAGALTGYSGTYAAGDQIGDPLHLDTMGGRPILPGEQWVVWPGYVVVWDHGKILDENTRVWLVNDLDGGGIGDAGDGNPIAFSGTYGFAELSAQAITVHYYPDGSRAIVDTATRRKLVFVADLGATFTSESYLVVEAGGSVSPAPDTLYAAYGGVLIGAIPAPTVGS